MSCGVYTHIVSLIEVFAVRMLLLEFWELHSFVACCYNLVAITAPQCLCNYQCIHYCQPFNFNSGIIIDSLSSYLTLQVSIQR